MQYKQITFYYREGVPGAKDLGVKLSQLVSAKFPRIKISNKITAKTELVITLGGDGTILEAVQKSYQFNPVYLGLNLGSVGFLASIRDKVDFKSGLLKVLGKNIPVIERMLLAATIKRGAKTVFSGVALNELLVQSLLGMVDITVKVNSRPLLNTWGTGIMIATPTGSTAYNLSAHGPILEPDLSCMIITKLLDHNIPTPSIIVNSDDKIELVINSFRKENRLKLNSSGENIDVMVGYDAQQLFPAEPGDVISITRSAATARFVELEPDQFFKSLSQQFSLT